MKLCVFCQASSFFGGDAWGTISVPLIEQAPWTGILLYIVICTIGLGVMNLILAVIVERATEARENDHEQKIKKKEEERSKSMVDLAKLCASMDENNNGLVSLEEMQNGYDQLESFRKLLQQMDIKRDEMQTIFTVLDSDNHGEVSYLEFCQNIGGFLKRDPIIMHSVVHCSVLELRKLIREEVLEVMQEQHKEVMEAQNRLLAAAGLKEVKVKSKSKKSRSARRREDFVRERKSQQSQGKVVSESHELQSADSAFETLAKMEEELQPLLDRAQEIAESLLDTASGRTARNKSVEAHESKDLPALPPIQDESPRAQKINFDGKFQRLCERFQRQQKGAGHLQRQLAVVLENLEQIESSTEEFHRRMFCV